MLGCSFSSFCSRTTEKLSSQPSLALERVDLPGSDGEVEPGPRGQQAIPELVEIQCNRKANKSVEHVNVRSVDIYDYK